MRALTLLAAALVLSSSALAYQGEHKGPDIAGILENQATIRAEIESRQGAFKAMSERDRHDLQVKSERVTTTLQGHQWGDLSDEQQVDVFNKLEEIKAAITAAEDQRLVCQQKKRPGSNLIMKQCRTVARLRAQREDTQGFLVEIADCRGQKNCGLPTN